jgi:hypothetical protein
MSTTRIAQGRKVSFKALSFKTQTLANNVHGFVNVAIHGKGNFVLIHNAISAMPSFLR